MCFQGGKIRAKLVAELSGAEGVVIEEGTAGDAGKAAAQSGMRRFICVDLLCFYSMGTLLLIVVAESLLYDQVYLLLKPSR